LEYRLDDRGDAGFLDARRFGISMILDAFRDENAARRQEYAYNLIESIAYRQIAMEGRKREKMRSIAKSILNEMMNRYPEKVIYIESGDPIQATKEINKSNFYFMLKALGTF
jgi:hypothetical protein